jgi:UPF0755 protein
MKKSHFYAICIPGFLVCYFVFVWLYFLFTPVISKKEGYVYYLRPGTSKKAMMAELTQQGIISHPFLYSLFVYPQKNAQLKTAEYFFPKGSTPYSIWKQITSGKGLYYRPFSIIPGWSFNQLRHALSQAQGIRHSTAKLNDNQIMQRLGNSTLTPEGEFSPEGEFFPETYYYTRGISDLVILKHAFNLMQNRLTKAWENRAQKLPYKTAYEALIAASLIEKEAYLNSERPVISGVLVNRLKRNMLLQFDPTVIYGLGQRYDGKIHKENLLDNNPYNTYIHRGLPPTPIAIPSMKSIEAIMHPQQNDYLYFVAKGDGSHQFSKTLTEHNAAVDSAMKQQHQQITITQ